MSSALRRHADAPLSVPEPSHETIADEVALTWTTHLARRQRSGLLCLALCLALVFVCGLLLFRNALLALLPVAAVLLSVAEYLFPIRYTLTRQIARCQYGPFLLEMRWEDVQHAYVAEQGVKLSPLRRRNSRFEPMRGIFLRFDTANREQVMNTVKRLRTESGAGH